MKLNAYLMVLTAVMAASFAFGPEAAAQQQNEGPDLFEQAEAEADRLQRILDLEDWQVFYVDSTLKHDFTAMIADYEELRASKVENSAMYQNVQDRWASKIDSTYRRIFTESQWKAYLKSGAGKAIKAREKRRMKAQEK